MDYENCIDCGVCLNKCKNGVYEKRENSIVVVNPQVCIQGCRGCQNLCPADAISYVGDTGKTDDSECSCGCCDC
nr:4Fe-4S dicluster domain-containing protein [Peptoclostridium litorale]